MLAASRAGEHKQARPSETAETGLWKEWQKFWPLKVKKARKTFSLTELTKGTCSFHLAAP